MPRTQGEVGPCQALQQGHSPLSRCWGINKRLDDLFKQDGKGWVVHVYEWQICLLKGWRRGAGMQRDWD